MKLEIEFKDANDLLDELPEIMMQIQFNGKKGGNKTTWQIK